MSALNKNVHLGTSSWSCDDWKTAGFYPADMEPRDYLAHYAKTFTTVEVDSSFYRSPSPSVCKRWRDVTPDGFTFALKVPGAITHEKVLVDCGGEWDPFITAAGELGKKLGFLVLQFAYFNKSSSCPSLDAFLERLGPFVDKCVRDVPLVVEVRNKTWLKRELLDFLKERKLILALTEQEWMPKIRELWQKFGHGLATGPAVYARFLGERKRIEEVTKAWDKVVIDRTEETRAWLPSLEAFLAEDLRVWIYFNNHYAGYAPASIELLKHLWNIGLTGLSPVPP